MAKQVFEDAMHRQEINDQPTEDDLRLFAERSVAKWPTPEQYLPGLKKQISAFLTASGFPAPEQAVFHRGRFWCERFDGERPDQGAPVSAGWAYARRTTEPLTPEREAADLYFYIIGVEQALTKTDPDLVFAHAVILGSAVNRFNARQLHLEAVTRGVKVKKGLRSAAATTNALHGDLRQDRFTRMAELIKTMNVDKAAAQCQHEGLGNWDTIKRQWNRHHKKRDT